MPENRERTVAVAPSILAADFSRLGEQVREAVAAGAEMIHVDVMDGRFVPNITIGPLIVEACRRVTDAYLDVHLMIEAPERFLDAFAAAGASGITVHVEATPHLHRALQQIREAGCQVGAAVNPLTPLEVLRDALPYLDRALLMTVNPGFGGQAFIGGSVERIERVARWRDARNPSCRIEVDGGISVETAAAVVRAGADDLVAGSAIYGSGDIAGSIARLREAARR